MDCFDDGDSISCRVWCCGRESEFYQHDTMYKSGDHLRFSIYGYREVSPNEAQKSNDQKWWGIDVK